MPPADPDESAQGGVTKRSIGRLIAIPVVSALAYLAVDHFEAGASLLATLQPATRQALFISVATTAGALLGFAIAGMTILLTLGSGPRLQWLKSNSRFRDEVRFLFTSAIGGLGATTVAYMVLIAVGTTGAFQRGWGVLATATAALALDRLWRLIVFLNRLMAIALLDADERELANPPFTDPVDDY